jgi:hypothetical protein
MKLYLDDVRDPPDGWQVVRTYDEAIRLLSTQKYEEISLDHDLGCFDANGKEYTGYDLLKWLIERKLNGEYVPPKIRIHTMNSVGMAKMIFSVKRYWDDHPQ